MPTPWDYIMEEGVESALERIHPKTLEGVSGPQIIQEASEHASPFAYNPTSRAIEVDPTNYMSRWQERFPKEPGFMTGHEIGHDVARHQMTWSELRNALKDVKTGLENPLRYHLGESVEAIDPRLVQANRTAQLVSSVFGAPADRALYQQFGPQDPRFLFHSSQGEELLADLFGLKSIGSLKNWNYPISSRHLAEFFK